MSAQITRSATATLIRSAMRKVAPVATRTSPWSVDEVICRQGQELDVVVTCGQLLEKLCACVVAATLPSTFAKQGSHARQFFRKQFKEEFTADFASVV